MLKDIASQNKPNKIMKIFFISVMAMLTLVLIPTMATTPQVEKKQSETPGLDALKSFFAPQSYENECRIKDLSTSIGANRALYRKHVVVRKVSCCYAHSSYAEIMIDNGMYFTAKGLSKGIYYKVEKFKEEVEKTFFLEVGDTVVLNANSNIVKVIFKK